MIDRRIVVRTVKSLRTRKQLSEDKRSLQVRDKEINQEKLRTDKIFLVGVEERETEGGRKLICSQH